jgi:hypothetical protein
MVLQENGRLPIASVEPVAAGEIDRAYLYSLRILHGDGLRFQLPVVVRTCEGRAKLDGMVSTGRI